MSVSQAIDLDHLRSWVGRERRSEQVLDPFPARAMAGLLDREWVPQPGDALPMPWHWLYFHDTPRRSELGEDGHPRRGDFLPPVPLPRRMWAAGQLTVAQDLILGERTVKTSTVRSVDLKVGRSGPLVFVTVEHRLEQGGVACLIELQDLVYREAPAAQASPTVADPAPARADWRRQLVPDSRLLFRYSALTYNGHRIHYDSGYSRQVESYPDLVVHGPLQVTLLLDLLQAEQPLARIERIKFRAHRPSFVDRPLELAGCLEGTAVELWTADADGALGMRMDVALRREMDPS